MPTIKLKPSGAVILKDGKASCSCCGCFPSCLDKFLFGESGAYYFKVQFAGFSGGCFRGVGANEGTSAQVSVGGSISGGILNMEVENDPAPTPPECSFFSRDDDSFYSGNSDFFSDGCSDVGEEGPFGAISVEVSASPTDGVIVTVFTDSFGELNLSFTTYEFRFDCETGELVSSSRTPTDTGTGVFLLGSATLLMVEEE